MMLGGRGRGRGGRGERGDRGKPISSLTTYGPTATTTQGRRLVPRKVFWEYLSATRNRFRCRVNSAEPDSPLIALRLLLVLLML